MKKLRQISALVGVILLVGLYVSTLIFAITDSKGAQSMFVISVLATIIIPIYLWILNMILQGAKRDVKEKEEFIQKVKEGAEAEASEPDASEADAADSKEEASDQE